MSDINLPPDAASDAGAHRYSNRLIHETSPYLLQHAHNPVDWYPWGPEALDRARVENKPILLSVGYAACHWCHVMERECFENERIATIMNLNYVCIKVDREERPDIDAIYMSAVQAMTGKGGWPMTLLLTPEGLPFFAGTYFPPEERYGMPGFPDILRRLAEFYRTRRADVDAQAEELRVFFATRSAPPKPISPGTESDASEVDVSILAAAERNLARSFDLTHGGFNDAPKFPHAMDVEFLLRRHLRTPPPPRAGRVVTRSGIRPKDDLTALGMVTRTLDAMAAGGLFDQLGGGFHRYTVDDHWLVPHFEKMLYDNALLARVYLHAYQVTGEPRYARVCRETLDYVRREMTSPEGGFYSTQDADSEGEEGRFYLWRPEEIGAVLEESDALLCMEVLGVTLRGNFERTGASVLHQARPVAEVAAERGLTTEEAERRLADARLALFAARQRRAWPRLDDKVICAWNGLMLRAFAEAASAFDSETYAEVAATSAAFLLDRLRDADGRLRRVWRQGQARVPAFLEDYANLIVGLLATYEATFETRWFTAARELAGTMVARFSDEAGFFYDTADDHERLAGRPREVTDNATPAGASVAVEALLWLAALTGEHDYRARAEGILVRLAPAMAQQPAAFGYLLCCLDRWLTPSQEVAIIGDRLSEDTLELLATVRGRFRPNTVVACAPPAAAAQSPIPLLADRPLVDGLPTAYVCSGFTCQLPVNDADALAAQLGDA